MKVVVELQRLILLPHRPCLAKYNPMFLPVTAIFCFAPIIRQFNCMLLYIRTQIRSQLFLLDYSAKQFTYQIEIKGDGPRNANPM